MTSEEDLKRATEKFFNLHWPDNDINWPIWSPHWTFDGEIPNHMHPGCYALFSGDKLVYIGIGISKGTDFYKNHGLGFRLKNYWQVDQSKNARTKYKPREKWNDLTSIITIPFTKYSYLAAALEIYLISNLKLERNKLHVG